jgi:hypothetical protein
LTDATRTSPAALVAVGKVAWGLWQSMSVTQRAQAEAGRRQTAKVDLAVHPTP